MRKVPGLGLACRMSGLCLFLAAITHGGVAQSAPAVAADPKIAAALKDVSARQIQANIEKLVSFGTRSTLSAQDPGAIASGRGIGAAREWSKSEFERYSKDCGGCLEVKTDSYTQEPGERVKEPTVITNVYAVLKGTDAENAKRIVLVTGHYDSRNSDNYNITEDAPGANDARSYPPTRLRIFGKRLAISSACSLASAFTTRHALPSRSGCRNRA